MANVSWAQQISVHAEDAARLLEVMDIDILKKKIVKLKIADKIKKREGNVTPRFKVKALFYIFRSMQKRMHFNPVDVEYWKKNGWLEKVRPW